MDIREDRFLKLVALGWDGKQELDKFFDSKYGVTITTKKIYSDNLEKIIFHYTENGEKKTVSIVRNLKKRIPKELEILRLFRTVDGIIYGPSSVCFGHQHEDWT